MCRASVRRQRPPYNWKHATPDRRGRSPGAAPSLERRRCRDRGVCRWLARIGPGLRVEGQSGRDDHPGWQAAIGASQPRRSRDNGTLEPDSRADREATPGRFGDGRRATGGLSASRDTKPVAAGPAGSANRNTGDDRFSVNGYQNAPDFFPSRAACSRGDDA